MNACKIIYERLENICAPNVPITCFRGSPTPNAAIPQMDPYSGKKSTPQDYPFLQKRRQSKRLLNHHLPEEQ